MTNRDEQILAAIYRRNWILLVVFVLLSLLARSASFTLGVLGGGLVAIGGFYWLRHSLVALLEAPSEQAAKGFKLSYFIRLGALAAALAVLIVPARVHPVGLAIGLSVVVVNLIWTTLKRLI